MENKQASFYFYYNNPLYYKYKENKITKQIISEINKIGLPIPEDVENKLAKTKLNKKVLLIVTNLSIGLFLYKVKVISLINKLTIAGIFSICVFSSYNISANQEFLDYLIFSDSYIGQEARILTKWFNPDHSKIKAVEGEINEFRNKIDKQAEVVRLKKEEIMTLVKTEKEEEEKFINELKKKLH